jgi:hypothetical protein
LPLSGDDTGIECVHPIFAGLAMPDSCDKLEVKGETIS